MDKNIKLTVSLDKLSEKAEKEFIEKARELSEWLTVVYGAKVSIEWTAAK